MVRRRTVELQLVLLVGLITAAAYVLAGLAHNATVPTNLVPFLGIVVALVLGAHLANRRLAPRADAVILPLVAMLNGIGYVFIVRLDHRLAALQALWTAIGICAYVLTLWTVRRIRDLDAYRWLIGLGGLALLLMPLLPHVGQTINGARLWLRVGSVSIQPVEVSKLALTIFFASYLAQRREVLSSGTRRVGNRLVVDPRHLGPIVGIWALSILIMTAERDIGFSVLLFGVFVALLWVATARMSYVGVGIGLFGAGVLVAGQVLPHTRARIDVWLDPWSRASGTGYQSVQALFSLGSGHLVGTGLGLGNPAVIPVVTSDFIFAAIGEELGLLGTTAVVVCFVLLVGSGLRVAMRSTNDFDALLVTGLTFVLGLQGFLIMAGVTRLLPLTGLTLPFVSYGGSSLIANYALVALLVRASDEQATREETGAKVVAVHLAP